VTVLVAFWVERTRDGPCVSEALDGLLALAQTQALPQAAIDAITTAYAAPWDPRMDKRVSMCVCVSVCVCLCVSLSLCAHACAYVYLSFPLRSYLSSFVSLSRSHLVVYVCVCVDACLTLCVYMRVCVCVCVIHRVLEGSAVAVQPQAVRLAAYAVLAALVERHHDAVRARGIAAIFGMVRAMDGEKDPRNLMAKLGLLRRLAVIVPLTDELAEVTGPARGAHRYRNRNRVCKREEGTATCPRTHMHTLSYTIMHTYSHAYTVIYSHAHSLTQPHTYCLFHMHTH
jgi:hypothetical protein